MKRDIAQLANKQYDLLVVGAGIHGACVAWDAALRGLSVALVDKGDFGHATSSNSLKTLHGGLRYLQDADLKLARTMVRERRAFMRIAPHLVHPLPCILPIYKNSTRNKAVMTAAMLANDLVAFDRNQLDDPQKHLPRSRVISRAECLQLLPGIPATGLTGGALWYDAQMYNSERLLLSVVLSASAAGADAANYVEVVGFLRRGSHIQGAKSRDVLTGEEFDIRARMVVNAAGAWADDLLCLAGAGHDPETGMSTAINLVTRQLIPKYALGVTSNSRSTGANQGKKPQLLFIAPWRDFSLIGTVHAQLDGHPNEYRPRAEEIERFVAEVNGAYPAASLEPGDVRLVHRGFLPAWKSGNGASDKVKLIRRGQVRDHERDDGVPGLVSVVGVKYTTARSVAQSAVDLVVKKLGKTAPECRTDVTPVYGGQIAHFGPFLSEATAKRPEQLSTEDMRHLVHNYGSEYQQILKAVEQDPELARKVSNSSQVMKAEIVHAVMSEQAQKLADVVFRRTELGSAGDPGGEALENCAAVMADTLGWSEARKRQELDEVRAAFCLFR